MVVNSHYIGPNPEDEPYEDEAANWDSGMLSVAEKAQLIQALSTGQRVFTSEDARAVLRWAEEARTAEMCLDLVLRGEVVLRMGEGGKVDPIHVSHVVPAL